ncbi:MAG: hypothetical protein E1N59_3334 [Puniceicoccaceae bacterium 5H]|nr:MAG: hypothetical protein E1N59_3334 [Puniceicoccaceae bacterium 5H]
MGIDSIKTTIERILDRKEVVAGRGEESTKQAMVLPMLEALGYDIWNPAEVCPEYLSDTAIKKFGQKEKVDYAILLNGTPRIFFEVKALDQPLEGHHGQLKRYFNSTPSVSLAVLTNGLEYRFYTDTKEQNIQDDSPFFIANLESIDQGLDVLARFQKSVFSPEAIREFATELNYTAKIVELLTKQIDIRDGELSDEFVRWILSFPGMYEGRVTANVLDRLRPIAREALQRVIRKIVRRTVAAIDSEVSSSKEDTKEEEAAVSPDEIVVVTDDEKPDETGIGVRKGIHTTEEELQAFAIIKNQFESSILTNSTIYEPSSRKDVPLEIGYKDTSVYFNIYFNKPSWWNLRLSLESKIKWIGIDLDPETAQLLTPSNFIFLKPNSLAPTRIQITDVNDLHTLNRVIYASFEKTIADRAHLRDQHHHSRETDLPPTEPTLN